MRSKKIFTILLLGQMLLCLLAGTIYLGISYTSGQWGFINNAVISELHLCPIDEYSIVRNTIHLNSSPTSAVEIPICGELKTSYPANLWIIVYKDANNDPVNSIDITDVKDGDFVLPVLIPSKNIPGSYQVDIIVRRKVISSIDFDIVVD